MNRISRKFSKYIRKINFVDKASKETKIGEYKYKYKFAEFISKFFHRFDKIDTEEFIAKVYIM
jgi:hypothetical protein